MQPIFENKTVLTEDLYIRGVKEYYNKGHRISRTFGLAYAVVMAFCGMLLLYDLNFLLGIPFVLVAGLLLFWHFKGYLISAKKSFKKLVLLHNSHYQVEMEFRFYEKRLEQETEKTELTVEYKNINRMYICQGMVLFVCDRNIIVLDAEGFIRGNVDEVKKYLGQYKIKIKSL